MPDTATIGRGQALLTEAFLRYEKRRADGNMGLGLLARFPGATPDPETLERELRKSWGATGWELAFDAPMEAPGGLRAAVAAILAVHAPSRPVLSCRPVHGYAEEEWALVFTAHHAHADGLSMVELAARCLGWQLERTPPRPWAPQGEAGPARNLFLATRGLVPLTRSFLPPAPGIAGAAPTSAVRRVAWEAVEADRVREIARNHGATVNDVVLASVLGAVGDWSASPWSGERLWTFVPVNARGPHEVGTIGNRAVGLRIGLPLGEPDPVRRLALITAATAKAKRRGAATAAWAAVQLLPTSLAAPLFGFALSPRQCQLIVSDWGETVAGSHDGRRATELLPLMFLPHDRPLSVGVATHAGRLSIGFVVDGAYGEGDELCGLWRRALDAYGAG
ncbi:wax ester/triacylglycerol synthase domain-containing protein [Phytomonospora sp. NPDC050363]|uniref:wax ester/triacylglycerol synthase domain-containing protein n=1 Tax=Phytomonospora sp. NPDC050363 TaxID=3155642 RepID=UPI003407BD7F